MAGCWAVRARANPLSLGVWHFTLRFVLPRSWVGYPRRRPKGCGMQSPSGPKVYPPRNGMGRMRGGRVRWRAWRARARPGRAGLAAWRVRGRVAQAWAAGARALGAGAGFGLQLRARAALGEGAGRARRPSAWPGRARGSSVAGVWPQDAGQRWVWPACACRAGSWWVCVQDAGGRRASTSARRIRRVTAVRPVSLV